MSKSYWKVSVFDGERAGYIVKKTNLSEQEAKELVLELERMGFTTRASKHKNKRQEYFYCK